jgi:formylmethanofuran dehydrogenase subunit E
VQLGSGATLGKRNIAVHAFNGPPYTVFSFETGDTVTVHLKPHLPDLITDLIERHGVEAAGEILMHDDAASLFTVTVRRAP